tara:strand:+ start:286 stop:2934 length:2649 start_codon:yes stop_codon:yes gene_type:complete
MRFVFLIFFLFPFLSISQITTAEYYLKDGEKIVYFDKDWQITSDKSKGEYYRIVKIGSNNEAIGQIKDYFKSGQIQNTIEGATYIDLNDDSKNIYDGKSLIYYESGELDREFTYVNGKINGTWRQYYKSGKIKRARTYIADKREGEDIRFYESGNTEIKMNYINGQLQGDWIAYYENGGINQTSEFVDGKREGLLKDFFETGELNFIQVYKNGLKIKEESFYKKGELEAIYYYNSEGELDGEGKIFYKSGKIRKLINYSNGKKNNEKVFFENGKISEEAENLQLDNATRNTYDVNGNLIFEEIWNEEFGKWTTPEFPKGMLISMTLNPGEGWNGDGYVDYWEEEKEIRIEDAYYISYDVYEGNSFSASSETGLKRKDYTFRIIDGVIQYLHRVVNYIKIENDKWVRQGLSKKYYPNTMLVEEEINYVNNLRDGEQKFYSRFGNVTNTVKWDNGVKDNWSMDCSGDECEYVFNSYFDSEKQAKNEGWSIYQNDKQRSFVITDKEDSDYQELYIDNKDGLGRINSITLPVDNGEDFQASVTADWWTGVDNNWFGIIAGWKDWDNYTTLEITANGYYRVRIFKKGVNLGMDDYKKYNDGSLKGNRTLNIVRVGNSIYFSISGNVIYSTEVYTLEGDEFGIVTWGKQSVLFDNFKVRKSVSESSPYIAERDDEDSGWSGNGSGIILTKDGYIATNHHVIEDVSDIEVEFIYNKEIKSFNAKLIRSDAVNDLAILKIDDPKFVNLTSIPYNFKTRSSDIGQEVFALGYPMALTVMGKDIKFTDGRISARSGYQGDITTYQTTTPIQPGNSGGPLFDTNGNLIAINSSILRADVAENVSYSIKTSYLLTLIDALPNSIPLPSSTYVATKPLTEQIKILSNYVVLIKVR